MIPILACQDRVLRALQVSTAYDNYMTCRYAPNFKKPCHFQNVDHRSQIIDQRPAVIEAETGVMDRILIIRQNPFKTTSTALVSILKVPYGKDCT